MDAYAAKVGGAQVVRLDKVGHGFGNERRWLSQYQQQFDELAPEPSATAEVRTEVGDLPLIEIPAPQGTMDQPFAILLSGDGGWAGLDKGLGAELAARGLPVVGWSTLKYYWRERTPEESARDLARVIQHYLAAWKRERVLLVGYSFGANVLPFIVNRLSPELRARIVGVGLLGLEVNTSFEIRVAGWLPGSSIGERPVRPEIEKLKGVALTCLYGAGEKHDPCAELAGLTMHAREIGTGHHFSGDYAALADAVLAGADLSPPAAHPAP